MKYDIAVVGGGVIGLACAWRLAQAGAEVALFERGLLGREASWAAAGMLAPQCEAVHAPAASDAAERERQQAGLQLGLASRALYPELADELLDLTGIDIELSLRGYRRNDWRTPGILYVVPPAPARGIPHPDFPMPDANRSAQAPSSLEHGLGGEARTLWLEDEGQVDNRKLVRALIIAARRVGVALHQCDPVRDFEIAGDQIVRLRTAQHDVSANQILLCAGAWSGQFSSLPPDCMPPVRPVAGTILSLRQRPRDLTHIVYSHGVYVVPRRDGRVLIGATMEEVGFNKQVRVHSVDHLLQSARGLMPALAGCAIEAQWTGLRPGSPDGLPVLGRTSLENLCLATGHFRNGILLTPITAQYIREYLMHGVDPPPAFRLARFGQPACREAVYAH